MPHSETINELAITQPDMVGDITLQGISQERELVLRRLLDGESNAYLANYESAKNLGLIDMFFYDPDTGEDGLVHTLSGDMVTTGEGAEIPVGFHHERSGAFGPRSRPSTVDRESLKGLNSYELSDYKENPYEPYAARVNVVGYAKLSRDRKDPQKVQRTHNSMFPLEYDNLTVLRAIGVAWENRDRTLDHVENNGLVRGYGFAPMIDGKNLMKITLLMKPGTEKIVSAYPSKVYPRGKMKLDPTSIRKILES